MRVWALACAVVVGLSSANAQTITGDSDTIRLGNVNITRETRIPVSSAPAASLRGLDKMSGESVDLVLEAGETKAFGYLNITMEDCRFPSDNPTGNAFAHLVISSKDELVFNGWMIASSPALVALDHPRYDVWVIRCKLDNRTPEVVAGESSPRPTMRP